MTNAIASVRTENIFMHIMFIMYVCGNESVQDVRVQRKSPAVTAKPSFLQFADIIFFWWQWHLMLPVGEFMWELQICWFVPALRHCDSEQHNTSGLLPRITQATIRWITTNLADIHVAPQSDCNNFGDPSTFSLVQSGRLKPARTSAANRWSEKWDTKSLFTQAVRLLKSSSALYHQKYLFYSFVKLELNDIFNLQISPKLTAKSTSAVLLLYGGGTW